jgi:hypothetical protein
MKGIQKGQMSKLGWLIGLVKHATWADSYFLYLLFELKVIFRIPDTGQSPKTQ